MVVEAPDKIRQAIIPGRRAPRQTARRGLTLETSGLDIRIGRAFYGSFDRLTEVQARAERPLLEGQDAMVLSGTGSGKTEAALAPLVQRTSSDWSREGSSCHRLCSSDQGARKRRIAPDRTAARNSWNLRWSPSWRCFPTRRRRITSGGGRHYAPNRSTCW